VPPRERNAVITEGLERLILDMLAKNRDGRPADMDAVIARLDSLERPVVHRRRVERLDGAALRRRRAPARGRPRLAARGPRHACSRARGGAGHDGAARSGHRSPAREPKESAAADGDAAAARAHPPHLATERRRGPARWALPRPHPRRAHRGSRRRAGGLRPPPRRSTSTRRLEVALDRDQTVFAALEPTVAPPRARAVPRASDRPAEAPPAPEPRKEDPINDGTVDPFAQ
jgi:hypothetical protein